MENKRRARNEADLLYWTDQLERYDIRIAALRESDTDPAALAQLELRRQRIADLVKSLRAALDPPTVP